MCCHPVAGLLHILQAGANPWGLGPLLPRDVPTMCSRLQAVAMGLSLSPAYIYSYKLRCSVHGIRILTPPDESLSAWQHVKAKPDNASMLRRRLGRVCSFM